MRINIFLILLFLEFFFSASSNVFSQNIYVAHDGNDINPGTISQPLFSLASAITRVKVGDTIFVRGGTFVYNSTITISKSGTSTLTYYIFAYKNERPILDFSAMSFSSSNKGISLKGSYWYIKGLSIKGAGDNGMEINGGSNNTVELCSFYENRDTGLQLSNGSSNNRIINCDSYFNIDEKEGNADGFAPKLAVGTGNYFYGCRAWQNSDDGWDGYMRGADNVSTTLENCWSFKNGYRKDGTQTSGNGNGFKMGGGDNGNSARLMHHVTLIKCVAFNNKVKGFDQNNNDGSMTLLNCTGFSNLTADYRITREVNSGQAVNIKNSVSYLGYVELGSFVIQEKNSWRPPFSVSAQDFVDIDPSSATASRKEDGSLPDITFLHLAPGSSFIDAGVDVGLPYLGLAPDLGAFEYDGPTSVSPEPIIGSSVVLNQNFPNPFNPETKITYILPGEMKIKLEVFDMLGRSISVLADGNQTAGTYTVTFNGSGISSGIFFYRLSTNVTSITKQFVLIK
jgi:hypothetical protein